MKIKLAPGFELSKTYTNTKDNYKVVHIGKVLAYVVDSGANRVPPFVIPLYYADIHHRIGKTWHIYSSYEYGDHLEDGSVNGQALAGVVAQAVGALEKSPSHIAHTPRPRTHRGNKDDADATLRPKPQPRL